MEIKEMIQNELEAIGWKLAELEKEAEAAKRQLQRSMNSDDIFHIAQFGEQPIKQMQAATNEMRALAQQQKKYEAMLATLK